MYAVYLHDTVHIWLHGHAEKLPWHPWVKNCITLHIEALCCATSEPSAHEHPKKVSVPFM
jgi:hypothetical protein